eukprot:TRINITY_DN14760_c0_g1_i1.p1 TRINITY_DN14760_c0_g1~~TRINITY_DN14760_c0_g1_i1.p1  ORF type:complete len:1810 (+),score=683.35 TRINITY_DN14760_c0_g1_i1:58-5487(+)
MLDAVVDYLDDQDDPLRRLPDATERLLCNAREIIATMGAIGGERGPLSATHRLASVLYLRALCYEVSLLFRDGLARQDEESALTPELFRRVSELRASWREALGPLRALFTDLAVSGAVCRLEGQQLNLQLLEVQEMLNARAEAVIDARRRQQQEVEQRGGVAWLGALRDLAVDRGPTDCEEARTPRSLLLKRRDRDSARLGAVEDTFSSVVAGSVKQALPDDPTEFLLYMLSRNPRHESSPPCAPATPDDAGDRLPHAASRWAAICEVVALFCAAAVFALMLLADALSGAPPAALAPSATLALGCLGCAVGGLQRRRAPRLVSPLLLSAAPLAGLKAAAVTPLWTACIACLAVRKGPLAVRLLCLAVWTACAVGRAAVAPEADGAERTEVWLLYLFVALAGAPFQVCGEVVARACRPSAAAFCHRARAGAFYREACLMLLTGYDFGAVGNLVHLPSHLRQELEQVVSSLASARSASEAGEMVAAMGEAEQRLRALQRAVHPGAGPPAGGVEASVADSQPDPRGPDPPFPRTDVTDFQADAAIASHGDLCRYLPQVQSRLEQSGRGQFTLSLTCETEAEGWSEEEGQRSPFAPTRGQRQRSQRQPSRGRADTGDTPPRLESSVYEEPLQPPTGRRGPRLVRSARPPALVVGESVSSSPRPANSFGERQRSLSPRASVRTCPDVHPTLRSPKSTPGSRSPSASFGRFARWPTGCQDEAGPELALGEHGVRCPFSAEVLQNVGLVLLTNIEASNMGDVAYWSGHMEQKIGLASEDVVGMPFNALLLTDRQQALVGSAIQLALIGKQHEPLTVTFVRADAERVCFRAHVVPAYPDRRAPGAGADSPPTKSPRSMRARLLSSSLSPSTPTPQVAAYPSTDSEDVLSPPRVEPPKSALLVCVAQQQSVHQDRKTRLRFVRWLLDQLRHPLHSLHEDIRRGRKALVDEGSSRCHRQLLDPLQSQVRRLLWLVRQVEPLTRATTALAEQPMALRATMDKIMADFQPLADEKDISLALSFDSALPSAIYTDAEKLPEVISYLIHNAVAMTPHNGTVSVAVWRREQDDAVPTVVFAVRDNGVGIRREKLRNMFDPDRLLRSSTARTADVDLGLCNMKIVVEEMGGMLHVESRHQVGSAFGVILPLTPVEFEDSDDRPPSPRGAGQSTCLVMESNKVYRAAVCNYLWQGRYAVMLAFSLEEALANLRNVQILFLAIDALASGANFDQLIDRITRENPNLQVIFTVERESLSRLPAEAQASVSAVGVHLLMKPFRNGDMTELMNRAEGRLKVIQEKRDEIESVRKAFSERSLPWRRGKMLGAGAFGQVYEARPEKSGGVMAVKIVTVSDDEQTRHILHEIGTMSRLEHPNVIHYFYCDKSGKDVQMFMEFASGGSLEGVLRRDPHASLQRVAMVIEDVLSGLAFVHSKGVVHRDMKPANVLIGDDGKCKLADFGCAINWAQASWSEVDFRHIGTPQYMAPEVIRGEKHDALVDVWSLGCMLMEMMSGHPPFHHIGNWLSIWKYLNLDLGPDDPPNIGDCDTTYRGCVDAHALTCECIRLQAEARPSAENLLGCDFIVSNKSYSWRLGDDDARRNFLLTGASDEGTPLQPLPSSNNGSFGQPTHNGKHRDSLFALAQASPTVPGDRTHAFIRSTTYATGQAPEPRRTDSGRLDLPAAAAGQPLPSPPPRMRSGPALPPILSPMLQVGDGEQPSDADSVSPTSSPRPSMLTPVGDSPDDDRKRLSGSLGRRMRSVPSLLQMAPRLSNTFVVASLRSGGTEAQAGPAPPAPHSPDSSGALLGAQREDSPVSEDRESPALPGSLS